MKKNKVGLACAALVALGLVGPTLAQLPVSQTRADGYQVQEDTPVDAPTDAVTLDGVVHQVDPDRDRVTFTGDDGRNYTLDTSNVEITLRDQNTSNDVSDLTPGMRLHVVGKRLSRDIIAADRVRVLSDAPALAPTPAASDDDSRHIDLRGTVESLDKHQDSFVVHVNDHTRTIFIGNDTDLVRGDTPENFPLRPGDRVTVSGSLRADGTVIADTVILGRPADSLRQEAAGTQELVGRVTNQGRRDITIRLSSSDRAVKVLVPADVPVTRDGQPIALDDLTTDDVVRVEGTQDGGDFQADQVTVVHAGDNGG